jgi:CBS domain-containing protein
MQVRQVMSSDVQCCTAETPVPEVARMMVAGDCGAIPVVDDQRRPVGMVTDRDIAIRTVGKGQDPRGMKAGDCMTPHVVTVRAEADLHDAVRTMERRQVRRVPVVDEKGICVGVLAQADVARGGEEREVAEMVRDVSKPRGVGQV